MPKIQRALISLTDKTGAREFAQGLQGFGVEILSTGGTAKLLREAGVTVRDVSEVTGFPEMLDGRVKTIHPRIAGGVLAIRGNEKHMKALAEHAIPTIDMVVVNLYAFEKVAARPDVTVAELIENIDIGGPTLIRAAAKNYQDVAVVVSPDDYAAILAEMKTSGGQLSQATLWRLARKAFRLTADYDRAISARLARIEFAEGGFADRTDSLPAVLDLRADLALPLRYGENPHQSAALYSDRRSGIAGAEQLQGKELSYNNLVDLDAAWQLAQEFEAPVSAIIKHTNPCGCAAAASQAESYRKAFECDPVSAFGGVLAFNRPLDEDTAREIAKTFIEADRRARLYRQGFVHPGVKEEPAPAQGNQPRGRRSGDQVHQRRIPGTDGGHAPAGSRTGPGQERQASHGRRMGRAGVRLESGEAREEQRHRVHARGPDRGRRRWANEPRGFGEAGSHEGRAPASRDGGGLRRFLPVPGRGGGSGPPRRHGGDPARRLGAGPGGHRRGEPPRPGYGVHRGAPLPPLRSGLDEPPLTGFLLDADLDLRRCGQTKLVEKGE